jgi:hypothetical protein
MLYPYELETVLLDEQKQNPPTVAEVEAELEGAEPEAENEV